MKQGFTARFVIFLTTASSTAVVTPAPARPVHFPNFMSFDNGNYNASWMFNSSADTLHFMVEVRATGWIGFGFATQAPNNMRDYDVAVGGVTGGSGYIKVDFGAAKIA